MNRPRIVSAVVAAAFVFAPAVLFAAGVRPEAFENRPLAPAPEASDGWDALDAVPAWAADHLPGRERAVRSKSWIDYVVLDMVPPAPVPPGGPVVLAGPDGPLTAAPTVVRGRGAELFYGPDFDRACVNGRVFRKSLERLADVARLVERSGRRVVFSVAPNKSSVTTDLLPRVLPHGDCAERGIARESAILDDFADPRYLPMRQELADLHASGKQVFWRDDTHWSLVGSADYATRLARKLDPEVADEIRSEPGEKDQVGDLIKLAGLDFEETAPSEQLDTGATPTEDPSQTARPGTVTWTSSPVDRTVPGRTALIGDSFTDAALPNLQPLFADADFQWLLYVPSEKIVDSIVAADTVVLTVVQRNLVGNPLIDPAFVRDLRRALVAPGGDSPDPAAEQD